MAVALADGNADRAGDVLLGWLNGQPPALPALADPDGGGGGGGGGELVSWPNAYPPAPSALPALAVPYGGGGGRGPSL